uniref:Uncharacterized protein n=1 Tax=Chenopodium quinoa TaxID=63459 RepID=A0A803LI01_CHEQI
KYGNQVIVDLHAAPGSQNGNEHSGTRDGYLEWGKTDATVQQSVAVGHVVVVDISAAKLEEGGKGSQKIPSLESKEFNHEARTNFTRETNSKHQSLQSKIQSVEKSQPQQSPNKKRYQRLVFEDTEGNHLGGTLFGDEIDTFKDVLQLGKEYEIANAPLKAIDPKYQKRENDCQITFGGQTIIEPLDPTAGPVLPNYITINSIPKTNFKNERFDLLVVVLYIEEVRKVPTSGGNMMDPLTISMWGGLAVIDTEKLAGFSLASSMSTTIISDPTGEEAHALRTWMKEKQEMLLDQATKILHIRTPSRTTAAKTISDIEQKNAGNTMQEARHWIQATIPDAQVNFTFDVSDATGTLRLTAFAEDWEKLSGLPTSEIYEKKLAGD